jgi:hypothetical protein
VRRAIEDEEEGPPADWRRRRRALAARAGRPTGRPSRRRARRSACLLHAVSRPATGRGATAWSPASGQREARASHGRTGSVGRTGAGQRPSRGRRRPSLFAPDRRSEGPVWSLVAGRTTSQRCRGSSRPAQPDGASEAGNESPPPSRGSPGAASRDAPIGASFRTARTAISGEHRAPLGEFPHRASVPDRGRARVDAQGHLSHHLAEVGRATSRARHLTLRGPRCSTGRVLVCEGRVARLRATAACSRRSARGRDRSTRSRS